MRIIGCLCLLVAVLLLAGCRDGLYTGSYGYGYSGGSVATAAGYYRPGYGYHPSYGYAYSRPGHYGHNVYRHAGYGHHQGHGHHSYRYCD